MTFIIPGRDKLFSHVGYFSFCLFRVIINVYLFSRLVVLIRIFDIRSYSAFLVCLHIGFVTGILLLTGILHFRRILRIALILLLVTALLGLLFVFLIVHTTVFTPIK